ncbi:hypothetical protein B0A49_04510 [Cryomyces minteri]|uniref:White collar 1 protein n=1 Tax=Cryomyces minteri TaxID=331657 RepID=A0A4U0WVT1_9PEZI|nr:hypothetical protein B0A49_04510 [Cryomyces minteri]
MATMMGDVSSPMHMFSQSQGASPMIPSPLHRNFTSSLRGPSQDPGGGSVDQKEQFNPVDDQSDTPNVQSLSQSLSRQNSLREQSLQSSSSGQQALQNPDRSIQDQHMGFETQPQYPEPGSRQDHPMDTSGHQTLQLQMSQEGMPSMVAKRPPSFAQGQYTNPYTSTGFDMLGVLMRVATRPNPEINIGSVDLSCAFVVCDAEKDDFPIVYCSDNFERLTGYSRYMILGRNCRFLQAPDGRVEPGTKRKYVDDESVLYLRNMIVQRREAQITLINYRRGGQPFMNLLTTIPITWDTDQVKYYVGFQVDLVEQPNSVTNKNPDGSYTINYQRGMTMPRYIANTPENNSQLEIGQTIARDDVSTVLSTIGTGESELSKRIFDKMLLENTDDVIHVLSLKGLFLYLSPSSTKVLEYEAGELVGTALSSVCHPSDIVPVTRELKDTSTGATVNIVFRIRRKHSGYMWFEGHGSLHTEQGKGRKCIILVGRERPVYTLSKGDILANGGIGDNELWTKMSTSGMFLYVSSNVRSLLDRQPVDLVGSSIQSLMRQESKAEFGRIMEMARTGKKASVKHEMFNKRGQVLQAFTTLYPGDAIEGQKPTFVVAQTRFLKSSRASVSSRLQLYGKGDRSSSESMASNAIRTPHGALQSAQGTPKSDSQYISSIGAAQTYAGQNGLAIGHQDQSLASDENVFDELKTTRSTSWQFELRQMEKQNRLLAEEVQALLANKKKRKRRKGQGGMQKDCANCHTRVTPEWRRGPSGQRDLCNSCGLRWAKLNGRASPRTSSQQSAHSAASDKASVSPSLGAPNVNAAPPIKEDEQKPSPKQQNADSHAAKVARMEVEGGIPPKIEEDVEPD